LYICYEAVTEPLIASQVIGYLRPLARAGFEIHLLTFEKRPLSGDDRAAIRAKLREDGITWHALRYHRRPTVPATAFDIACGVARGALLCRRHHISFLHCRSHVAALMGLVIKAVSARPFIFDCRGLLADEYVDAGHWRAGGFLFRLTKAAERLILRHADAVVVLTERLRSELAGAAEPSRPIVAIPCCVDVPEPGTPAGRSATREARAWNHRFVCAYVGKLGGWYPVELIASFFAALRRQEATAFLYVATQSEPDALERALAREGIRREDWTSEQIASSDVLGVLAAADAGLSLILPCPSKRASSPTKVGEYLAAGVPVVSTPGIGDCDALFSGHRVGVITAGTGAADFASAATALIELSQDAGTRERCARVAQEHLSLNRVGAVRYAKLYGILSTRLSN
jgi:glycosyltransferase involved in cell wall biosynthesis